MFPENSLYVLSERRDLASVDLILAFLHLCKLAVTPMNFYVI